MKSWRVHLKFNISHTVYIVTHCMVKQESRRKGSSENMKIIMCYTRFQMCLKLFVKNFYICCDALLLGIWCEGETVFDLFPRFSLVNKNKVNHRVRHKVCQYVLLQNTKPLLALIPIECEQVLSCPPTLCGHLWNLKLQPAKKSNKPKRFLFIENSLLARPARKINSTANSTYIYDLF